jgi:DNA polymerase III subunit epsilon
MDFLTLDFETANRYPDSPCQLGISVVRGGAIAGTFTWLIRPHCFPHFDYWNIRVHGIKPEHVVHSPDFRSLWSEVGPILHDQLVFAHNAVFDMGVLRSTLQHYGMDAPHMRYACSVKLARKVWPGLRSYGLAHLCAAHRIEFRHHDAGADAEATAKVIIKAIQEPSAHQGQLSFSMDEFTRRQRVAIKALSPALARTFS